MAIHEQKDPGKPILLENYEINVRDGIFAGKTQDGI